MSFDKVPSIKHPKYNKQKKLKFILSPQTEGTSFSIPFCFIVEIWNSYSLFSYRWTGKHAMARNIEIHVWRCKFSWFRSSRKCPSYLQVYSGNVNCLIIDVKQPIFINVKTLYLACIVLNAQWQVIHLLPEKELVLGLHKTLTP